MSGAYDDAQAVTAALAARSRAPIGASDATPAGRRSTGWPNRWRCGDGGAPRRHRPGRAHGDPRNCRAHRPGRDRSAHAGDDGRGQTPRPRAWPPMRSSASAPPAIQRLASLVDDARWYAQRRASPAPRPDRSRGSASRCCSRCCGRPIRAWLRRPSSRSTAIHDPAAARAIHTVLRAATGEQRRAVIDALVAERDPRVVPMLVRIIEESEPLGKDHEVVLETLDALGLVPSDTAVSALARVIARRRFFGAPEAAGAQRAGRGRPGPDRNCRGADCPGEAAKTGDRLLRTIARRPEIGRADK